MGSYLAPDRTGREHHYDELVNYLAYCAYGRLVPLVIPDSGAFLDNVIGGEDFHPGHTPLLGEEYVAVLTSENFAAESLPEMLARLFALGIPCRVSQRFIFRDGHDAEKDIKTNRWQWKLAEVPFLGKAIGLQNLPVNEDAVAMRQGCDVALSLAREGKVSFGYYNLAVVVRHSSQTELMEQARAARRAIEQSGYKARIETENAPDALLATFPGHVEENVRRPMIHTANLADLMPLSGTWKGSQTTPNPLYPQGAPALLQGATDGNELAFVNLCVGDNANFGFFGPPGTGKAQPLDAKVLTPTGWRLMGDLAVGDRVVCPDGTISPIVGVYPQGLKPVFRVVFEDGRSAECCGEHLWKVWVRRRWMVLALSEIAALHSQPTEAAARLAVPLAEPFALEQPPQALPVPPYILGVLLGDGSFRTGHVSVATADPEHVIARLAEEMPEYEVAQVSAGSLSYRFRMKDRKKTSRFLGAPSVLSSMLSHAGETKSAREWAATLGVREGTMVPRLRKGWRVEEVLGLKRRTLLKRDALPLTVECEGVRRTVREWAEITGSKPAAIYWRLSCGWSAEQAVGLVRRKRHGHGASSLKLAVKVLGLMGKAAHEKSIPEIYKRGSVAQRLALLQGLLDTDGSVGNRSGTHATFTSTSERLARDVQEVAWSLGAIAGIARRQTRFTDKHGRKREGRPSWRVSIVHPDVVKLFSLPRKVELCRPAGIDRRLRISRIEEVGYNRVQCIKVGHPDGLYVTNDYVVTHNTTLLNATALQALRYRGMRVRAVDHKRGMLVACRAAGGNYYEIGGDGAPPFAPFAHLETGEDLRRAEDWVRSVWPLHMPGPFEPSHRDAVRDALLHLQGQPGRRSVTNFHVAVQNVQVRDVAGYYCHGGTGGDLFDGEGAELPRSHWDAWDITAIIEAGDTILLPALLCLMQQWEREETGAPMLQLIDEAWKAFQHPVWRPHLERALKTKRSRNVGVGLATQNLIDLSGSRLAPLFMENVPTRIYGANPAAQTGGADGPADLYKQFGLSWTQREIVRTATPKREYYLSQNENSRLIQFGLGPLTLALAGATGEDEVLRARALMAQHGDGWLGHHLQDKGITDHARSLGL